MKLSYLPEFAVLVTAHAKQICAEPLLLNDDIVGQQYIACRDRANHWMGEIDRTSGSGSFSAESLLASRHPLIDLAERILLNDILIRSWASVMVLVDRSNKVQNLESIARNLHLSQMVIRHRVISRVLSATGPTREEIQHINGLREKVERWTDMLIGQLGPQIQEDFAFQPSRAKDFATTYSRDGVEGAGPDSHVWRLVLTGIRSAFSKTVPGSSLVSSDDRNLLTSILAGLSPEVTKLTRDELGPRIGSLRL